MTSYEVFLSLLDSGFYTIDRLGRVFRLINRHTGKRIHSRADFIDRYGYRFVSFKYKGVSMNCYAHRLVWLRANGPIPAGMQINHKDGDKENNAIDNLELATPAENIHHGMFVLKTIKLRGASHPRAKLKLRDVARIFWWRGHGMECVEISSRLGVSKSQVYRILKRKFWRHFE